MVPEIPDNVCLGYLIHILNRPKDRKPCGIIAEHRLLKQGPLVKTGLISKDIDLLEYYIALLCHISFPEEGTDQHVRKDIESDLKMLFWDLHKVTCPDIICKCIYLSTEGFNLIGDDACILSFFC